MAEVYTVNYNINVNSQSALASLLEFQTAIGGLSSCATQLKTFQSELDLTLKKFSQMTKKIPTPQIATDRLNGKLNTVIAKLEKIHLLAKTPLAINTNATTGGKSKQQPIPKPIPNPIPKPKIITEPIPKIKPATNSRLIPRIPKNIGYRTLGPTMIDSGGIGAFDMLKGMGIAYGIAGLGSLMGGVVRDATEYDNLMKTAENILKTHDNLPDFDYRFKAMSQTIRDVGVETKFTAPQVADAARFLAMAGLNVEGINQSIRPIADLALIGDTDLGTTADVATNIMTGYRIATNNMRKAADVMTMTFTKSNTTLMEIAESYKYSSSLLSAANVPFEVATGALGILGDAGIKGSQAGTSMRTIIANLVNPTKKQSKKWNELGIKRFDDKGNLRSLTDIFGDLQKSDMSVDEYYKMFHRTAAQGAAALTAGIAKWNEIVRENFLSAGLSKKLADEKKNTIQGLWYQFTSAFTEVGMKAFEEIENPIKSFLLDGIEKLKSPETLTAIKKITNTIFNLINSLKGVVIKVFEVYQKLKWVIDLWLKFQITVLPILLVLRSFKAFFLSFGYLVNFMGKIMALNNSIGGLIISLKSLISVSSVKTLLPNLIALIGGKTNLTNGTKFSKYELARQRRKVLPQVYGGMGMIGGAIGGGWLGGKIGEAIGGGGGEVMGNVIGGTVGAGIGSLIASGALKALPVIGGLLSGPVGWTALAVAAIGGAAWYFHNYSKKVKEATKAHHEFLASTTNINGLNMSERATITDKYMSIIYNKQMSVNQSIGEHMRLMGAQLDFMEKASDDIESKTKFKDSKKYENINTNWNRVFSWKAPRREQKAYATDDVYENGLLNESMRVYKKRKWGHGPLTNLYHFNEIDFSDQDTNAFSKIAAARELYGLGTDTSEGSDLSKLIASFETRIFKARTEEDFLAVMQDIQNYINKLTYIPGSEYWTHSQVQENTEEINKQGFHYVQGQKKILTNRFDYMNPGSNPHAQLFAKLREVLISFQNGTLVEEQVRELLGKSIPAFDKEQYGEFGSDVFKQRHLFYDGDFHAGEVMWRDAKDGLLKTSNRMASEWQDVFKHNRDLVVEISRRFDPLLQPIFDKIIQDKVWNIGEKPKAGDVQFINGKYREWIANVVSPEGGAWQEITDKARLASLNETGEGGSGGGTGRGVSEADYKSNYSSSTAAPKQIIVKIENLMNVKSVDLSNPNNSAAIEDIKSQLSQALIDVVHDFDNTFHG
jgi:TP901 family phage tail tape measure protein